MMKKMEKDIDQMNYEEALFELTSITARLEEGSLPLEEMLKLYEHGQKLANRCNLLLDNAELKIKTLSGGVISADEPEMQE